jgi:hypothetical protein
MRFEPVALLCDTVAALLKISLCPPGTVAPPIRQAYITNEFYPVCCSDVAPQASIDVHLRWRPADAWGHGEKSRGACTHAWPRRPAPRAGRPGRSCTPAPTPHAGPWRRSSTPAERAGRSPWPNCGNPDEMLAGIASISDALSSEFMYLHPRSEHLNE